MFIKNIETKNLLNTNLFHILEDKNSLNEYFIV